MHLQSNVAGYYLVGFLGQSSVSKVLKCAGNDDSVTLRADDDGDAVSFVFESPGFYYVLLIAIVRSSWPFQPFGSQGWSASRTLSLSSWTLMRSDLVSPRQVTNPIPKARTLLCGCCNQSAAPRCRVQVHRPHAGRRVSENRARSHGAGRDL